MAKQPFGMRLLTSPKEGPKVGSIFAGEDLAVMCEGKMGAGRISTSSDVPRRDREGMGLRLRAEGP
jgi:hypothetical protein